MSFATDGAGLGFPEFREQDEPARAYHQGLCTGKAEQRKWNEQIIRLEW